jgi:IS1 family transposase
MSSTHTKSWWIWKAHAKAVGAILKHAWQTKNDARAAHFRLLAGRLAQMAAHAWLVDHCAMWAVASGAAPDLETAKRRLALESTQTLSALERRIARELEDERLRTLAHEALQGGFLPWGMPVGTYNYPLHEAVAR